MDIQSFFIWGLIIWFAVSVIAKMAEQQKKEKQRKREIEAEIAFVDGVMNGLEPKVESQKIFKMLRETLPSEYHCAKQGCNGILLQNPQSAGYFCSRCHNQRMTVRIKKIT